MPKICNVWTAAEIQFLRENYKTKGGAWVAERLTNRSLNSVRIQAFYLNQVTPHAFTPKAVAPDYKLSRNKGKVAAGQDVEIISAPRDEAPLPPAVIERDFIRRPTLAQLMAGRA